jgi:hypothetical protein
MPILLRLLASLKREHRHNTVSVDGGQLWEASQYLIVVRTL